MAKVHLKKLEKIYPNGFKAVHGIELEIKDGEFMVFVGPSGCAKSTILRMVAGLEEVSGGELWIGDRIVNNIAPKNREVAMVFQNYALYPHMTAYENMAFGLKLKKTSKKEIDNRVRQAAEKLEISSLLERKPKEMSGGQRQRVAVGRTIVRKPEVFLFDEPLSNLDAKLRVSMRLKITQLHKQLKEEGQAATMIYVTHDQVEAMTMGDRICVLDSGKIMQVDTPLNLYIRPKNKFVAGFIGSPAMNIKKATLKEKNGYVIVEITKDFSLKLPYDKGDKVRKYIGKKIWFGMRPENISIKNNGIPGEVTVVEEMGNEQYIHILISGEKFTARSSSENALLARHGGKYNFIFDMKKCHIFDFESEKNISL
ncbi:ABC transporter ATP-binding protein [Ilyobacter polytropus]|uniref:Carbohydrate ABC transporter ATP-binding protein, CUT1 family n=1 Tax=Ilyobacter polytropus (strain ATCC 51220 / DSM 2926 / LMG 16218 / CuHBu1) TaxID=572544 RepID=E3HCL5_ILYPC|nr:sn-glycerol-3-phosphate ABC transporter ATP-binding protein UgpC [Ilyobacter polytropus]ADO83991.1 carbohydrate ABC transporter ATP-binding protein, CUT1 family [Ilyobacter polytropus DSM 2926]